MDVRTAQIHALARVPEHSVAFMRAMAQGSAFTIGPYLFFSSHEWLLAIGYPLEGDFDLTAFDEALEKAVGKTAPHGCRVIAPELPARLASARTNSDAYYLLDPARGIPVPLTRHLRKAAALLRVDEGREFTPAHRRLWAEFLGRTPLPPEVRELFARTSSVLNAPDTDLRLLNAWDGQGRLAASLLLDYAPANFLSYLLGAHSRLHYTPHAADLLFAAMIERANAAGKKRIHLGLGVNAGIARFKSKWGGAPALAYRMAAWQEAPPAAMEQVKPGELVESLLVHLTTRPQDSRAGELLLDQRRFAMLWELEKNGRVSWIGGTAHTSRYSFAPSFRKLFAKVDTVIFEGPLDAAGFALVEQSGRLPPAGTPRVAPLLDEREIRALERVVRGPEGKWARFFNMEFPQAVNVRFLLEHTAPWFAFFTLWNSFLERRGWLHSVDLEAWNIARDMGKTILGMESIQDQIRSLEAISLERIVRFLRDCARWDSFRKRNVAAYLAGDLDRMMGSGAEFPTRTVDVIDVRDQRFREAMRPHLEKGRCAVFVGAAHMLNLRRMLEEDGFTLRPPKVSALRTLRARWLGW